ncbi:MAG TPA: hypothetical protein VFN44_16390 [Solirubrobacteraceae bacterium]|nr:hypothetical protein [Solirubrobacteraceae bacterium]
MLGREEGDDSTERVVGTEVRGRWVAWWVGTVPSSSQGPYSFDRVLLADVRGGRRVDVGGTGCEAPPRSDGLYHGRRVYGLALTGAGRLAWACYGGRVGDSFVEIRKFDAAGPGLLDREDGDEPGADFIDPGSLAIAADAGAAFRGRVFWSRRSGPRSADLR